MVVWIRRVRVRQRTRRRRGKVGFWFEKKGLDVEPMLTRL